MTAKEIADRLGAKLETGTGEETAETVYVGDLLSDVMGHAGEDCALVTIQNHLNTIAVCTLVGCRIIILCHSRPVPPDMAQSAKDEEIAIMTTPLSQYEVALALSSMPPSKK